MINKTVILCNHMKQNNIINDGKENLRFSVIILNQNFSSVLYFLNKFPFYILELCKDKIHAILTDINCTLESRLGVVESKTFANAQKALLTTNVSVIESFLGVCNVHSTISLAKMDNAAATKVLPHNLFLRFHRIMTANSFLAAIMGSIF